MWDIFSFLSSPQPPFYSTYSAMSMAHAHVLRESWKNLRLLKYETIAWLVIGVVHDLNTLCGEDGDSQTIWFCRDNFLWPCYFEKTWLLWLVCLKYYYFLCQYELLSWIFWIWIFMPQLRRFTLKLCQVALCIKNSPFIIYLLEDEQELSLGMPDTSPTYL